MKKINKLLVIFSIFISVILSSSVVFAEVNSESIDLLTQDESIKIDNFIQNNILKSNIPGMTVVIVKGDQIVYLKGFGYSNKEKKIPVTSKTSFEIASCSKAFTAVAVLELEKEGIVNLDDPVSKYFPQFKPKYKNKVYEITLRQLLHHSSGIPWYSITEIPISNEPDALYKTVQNVFDVKLNTPPGTKFEYSTVNYAIVGAVIQKVTGQPFEDYVEKHVFRELGLENTTLYPEDAKDTLASGYKYGFFEEREYEPPIFRGNRPAGYVIMNGEDLGKWLMCNLGTLQTPLHPLIMKTHVPDRTVPPSTFDLSSYAMGWADYQFGTGEVSKSGLNPNYSAYMVFRPEDKIAVGVMANNGTMNTFITGHGILDIFTDKNPTSPYESDKTMDNVCSLISIVGWIYILLCIAFTVSMIFDICKKNRTLKIPSFLKVMKCILKVMCTIPFLFALYYIPMAFQQVSWTTAIVWGPISLKVGLYTICIAIALSYICIGINGFFPKNDDKESLPLLVILSLISGIANAFIIFIVTISIGSDVPLRNLIFYYLITLILYIFIRKVVESSLVRMVYKRINTKRVELVYSIMKCSYSELEKIENGRIMATLNNDTEVIGLSSNVAVSFATSLITVLCCIAYLATISLYGAVISIAVIALFSLFYSMVNNNALKFWQKARDTQNVYMNYVDHLIKGLKELSIHQQKKNQFLQDVEESCNSYKVYRTKSRIKFTNATIVGESLLIIVLGVVAFVFPKVFKNIHSATIIKFIVVFLYMIGPMNGLLQAVPDIMQIKECLKRIQTLLFDIRSQSNEEFNDNNVNKRIYKIEKISYKDISYQYSDLDNKSNFFIGPVTISAERGQIIFITGGNGSGKTTLAKLMVGLYSSKSGEILINNTLLEYKDIGEYISAVFSDYHLFERLYEIDFNEKREEIDRYLKILKLSDKVTVKDGKFSTLQLSSGQLKRLALLVCYFEDRPVCLFDEWAADQDPEFRKYFYTSLLNEMKKDNKIVFVITHDDRYFDVADKLYKMEYGQLVELKK